MSQQEADLNHSGMGALWSKTAKNTDCSTGKGMIRCLFCLCFFPFSTVVGGVKLVVVVGSVSLTAKKQPARWSEPRENIYSWSHRGLKALLVLFEHSLVWGDNDKGALLPDQLVRPHQHTNNRKKRDDF